MVATSNYETIIYQKRDAIAEIRFNRPDRLNAVVKRLYDEILAALGDAERDDAVRVIVLTGEGRAFCVGADMKEHGRGQRTDYEKRAYLLRGNDVCERIHTIGKPVIAAVNGYALGAGAEMAISSDFVIMMEAAELGLPEVSIGTHVGGGVSAILPRLVGLAKARELIFLGERIDGAEAKRIGLATECLPAEGFMEGVYAFARKLAAKAPVSMAFAKEHLNFGHNRDYKTLLITELEAIRACMTTRDWQEGVDAFAEKRKPVFEGR